MKKLILTSLACLLIFSAIMTESKANEIFQCPDLTDVVEDDYFVSAGLHFYPAPANIYKASYDNDVKILACHYHGTSAEKGIYIFKARIRQYTNCQFTNHKAAITCNTVDSCQLICH